MLCFFKRIEGGSVYQKNLLGRTRLYILHSTAASLPGIHMINGGELQPVHLQLSEVKKGKSDGARRVGLWSRRYVGVYKRLCM